MIGIVRNYPDLPCQVYLFRGLLQSENGIAMPRVSPLRRMGKARERISDRPEIASDLDDIAFRP